MMKHANLKTGLLKKTTLNKSSLAANQYVKKDKLGLGSQKTKLCSESSTLSKGHTELKVKAKSGSSRLVGDKEESQVENTFKKAGLKVSHTANSGATNFDGDLLIAVNSPDYIRAEVKFRNSEGFTIIKEHWEMIKLKALRHGGTPALITVNKNKEQLITLNVEHLALLLEKVNTK